MPKPIKTLKDFRRAGGTARMQQLSASERSELARKAIQARWQRYREAKAATVQADRA